MSFYRQNCGITYNVLSGGMPMMNEINESVPEPAKPVKVKRVKPKSRQQRWNDAVTKAQEALSKLQDVKQETIDAISELNEIKQEFSDWKDNLPENLVSSPLGEKLEAIVDLDLEPDENDFDAMETAISEAEAADLPLGFGRD